MRNILVIGYTGLVGTGITKFYKKKENVNLITVDLNDNFDLRDKKSIINLYKSNPEIEYIINCSGINDHVDQTLDIQENKTDLENIDLFLDINVKSVCWMIEYAKEYLKDLKSIVNFGSIYSIRSPYHPIYKKTKSLGYTVSKHALDGITKYYSTFYAKEGITLNTIRIGGIETVNQSKEFKEWFISRTPVGRMANVEDLCGAVDLLCTKEGSYISGQSICVDGGYTTW